MAVFGLLMFLIIFLWRKITIIEGNYFILEKRVDAIKKTDRLESINRNIESADNVMNEIFKDSTIKNTYCNINSDKCTTENNKLQKNKKVNNIDLVANKIDNQSDDIINYINVLNLGEIKTDKQSPIPTPISSYITNNIENKDNLEIIEELVLPEDNEKYLQSDLVNTQNVEMSIGTPINHDNIDNDNVSVSSDITFGNEIDKTLTKKYKNMNVEKLREECKEHSLNTEGTKAILISRILEHNKKLK